MTINALLLAAGLCLAAGCSAGAWAQGTTVAIGGALQHDNQEIWSHLAGLVQRTDGSGDERACYSIISIASGEPDAAAAQVATNLARHGGRGMHLRVGPRIDGQDVAAAVADPRRVAVLRGCRGIYLTGGAQERLLDALQPGGHASLLLQAMQQIWQEGGVIAGSSAGAAVLSADIFRSAPDALAVMKGRLREGAEWARGFGFAPAGVIFDQHAVRRGRIGRLLPLMQARGAALGLAVEENSAAQIHGHEVRVLGGRGVLVVDLSDSRGLLQPPSSAPFTVQGATLHWLQSGDRFDLATRRVLPSPRKLGATRLLPLDPQHRGYIQGPWFYADMLGEGMMLAAMTRLVDGDQNELRGLSFAATPATDDPAPDLGFEWRLWLDARTQGWVIPNPEAYTLSGVRLDIVPVRVQRPLYRPLFPPTPPKTASP